ncbi:ankyrin repeat-containing domain protein, partial [Cercophora scortea]
DANDRTALHRAAEAGHAPVAQQLLDHSPELIRARDHEGCTPLHHAASRGRVEVLELLVRRGAKLNVKD